MLFLCDSVSKHRSTTIWEGFKVICSEFGHVAKNGKNDKNHHFRGLVRWMCSELRVSCFLIFLPNSISNLAIFPQMVFIALSSAIVLRLIIFFYKIR